MSACSRWKAFQEDLAARKIKDVRIAQILGITNTLGNTFPAIITKYYANGNILRYMSEHDGVHISLVDAVRIKTTHFDDHLKKCTFQLSKIASAVRFMHEYDLIHGHICAVSIVPI